MFITAYQTISDILEQLNLAELMEEDFYDSVDHGELVHMLVEMLCNQMGLQGEQKNQILTAAVVHDIGKLKLSKNLYGRDKMALHVEEVKYMRMHAQLGMEMLQQCDYPTEILEAVYHHHENYDGSGYPDNLVGTQIPLSARIIRVCDTFAALISDRPYRQAFDMDTAVELMIEDFKSFDMAIFLEFIKVYHSEQFREVIDFAHQINAKQRYLSRNIS